MKQNESQKQKPVQLQSQNSYQIKRFQKQKEDNQSKVEVFDPWIASSSSKTQQNENKQTEIKEKETQPKIKVSELITIEQSNKQWSTTLMENFKVYKCDIENCPRADNYSDPCFNYHNISDRRRQIIYKNNAYNYYPDQCQKWPKCTNEKCWKAHTKVEIWYHPLIYKVDLCMTFQNTKECKLDKFCYRAHNQQERRQINYSDRNK